MQVSADLVRAMAQSLLGRTNMSEEIIAETAARLSALLAKARAADESALQRVAPAFSFHPGASAYTDAAPQEPAVWAGMVEQKGASAYGGAGQTGVVEPPPVPEANLGKGPEYVWWSAGQIAKAIRRRHLSPVEVTRTFLERAERAQPTLNAFVTITAESALKEARDLETAAIQGDFSGPLHGVPIALKDLMETAGVLTSGGSRALADYVPTQDATCVVRLRQAGAVSLGKTATHEFAFGPTTDSVFRGPTRNPYNVKHVPSGSSGGSGAGVAAGLFPIGMGTDTGGSVRMPSSVNGIFGIKPTYGRISKAGVFPLSWSLDHVGPLCRDAMDAAIVLKVLAGPDPLDPSALNVPVDNYEAAVLEGQKGDLKGLRLGLPVNWLDARVDGEVRAAFDKSVEKLRSMGARIVEVTLPPADIMALVNRLIVFGEVGAYHPPFLEQKAELYSPDVRQRMEVGQFVLARDYLIGQRLRTEITRQVAMVMKQVDAILTPATPIPAPMIGQALWDYGGGVRETVQESLIRFAAPFSVTGQPAASVPCGMTAAGLPIGLQVVGRPFEEALVLRISAALEQALPKLPHPAGF